MELLEKRDTTQPILIAEGTSIGAISQYSILFDSHFIQCNPNCTAAEGFATLFMAHYVFKLIYDPALENFWRFVQAFLFNIDPDEIKFTSKMIELRTRMLSLEKELNL